MGIGKDTVGVEFKTKVDVECIASVVTTWLTYPTVGDFYFNSRMGNVVVVWDVCPC